MLGTAGHVDHGKTALVKLFTGCDTDTLAEEQRRQMTIDLGFAPCRLANDRIVGVVDVPGHIDFIKNMVAGAHGIDVVILVVAADDGIMPQTVEHLRILTLLGKQHGLVALTKIDLVPTPRITEVMESLRRLLAGTFLENAPICPISNITGEGYQEFFKALNAVVEKCEDRPAVGPFRMWIEDVFTIRGSGTVITGIPTHGRVSTGDRLVCLPGTSSGRVRRIQVYGADTNQGSAGECIAINVPELDHAELHRGMVVCNPDFFDAVELVEAELTLLPDLRGRLKHASEVHLHVGTALGTARVFLLESDELTPGNSQFVQLRFEKPLPVAPGERFIIRASLPGATSPLSTTVGGGRILSIGNVRLRRKKPEILAALRVLAEAIDAPQTRCEQALARFHTPVDTSALARAALMLPGEVESVLVKLQELGRALRTPAGKWIHENELARAAQATLSKLVQFHQANPARAGMDPRDLLAALNMDPELFELAIARLESQGVVERRGHLLARKGWTPVLSETEILLAERLESELQACGFVGLMPEDLTRRLTTTANQIHTALRILTDSGRAITLPDGRYIHCTTLERAKQIALGLFKTSRRFTTMEFRDALGVSRKYAVPILDYLDSIRFTVRNGNQRTPGPGAKALLEG